MGVGVEEMSDGAQRFKFIRLDKLFCAVLVINHFNCLLQQQEGAQHVGEC